MNGKKQDQLAEKPIINFGINLINQQIDSLMLKKKFLDEELIKAKELLSQLKSDEISIS
jgi:hypothetical protein